MKSIFVLRWKESGKTYKIFFLPFVEEASEKRTQKKNDNKLCGLFCSPAGLFAFAFFSFLFVCPNRME
jgi:hypothetical protein